MDLPQPAAPPPNLCRLCSHVPLLSQPPSKAQLRELFAEPLPFEAKVDGIAFVDSSCADLSGRTALVQEMADSRRYRVSGFGGCLRTSLKVRQAWGLLAAGRWLRRV
jgi:hypothetical protein